jgi:hypothetical protein
MADTEEFRALIHKLKMLFLMVGYTEGLNILKTYLPPPIKPLFDLGGRRSSRSRLIVRSS